MGPESKRLWKKEIPPEPGTSPKRFASILGLEKAIRLRKPEGRDFSSIPPSAGYSDQSHHQRFQTRHGSRAVRLFSAVGDVQKAPNCYKSPSPPIDNIPEFFYALLCRIGSYQIRPAIDA